MKNSFSFSRFCQYAKAELMGSRRLLLMMLGGVAGIFQIIYYMNHISSNSQFMDTDGVWHEAQKDVNGAVPFVWFVIITICVVNLSMSFKNYFNKGYANSTMMMPVAKSEKFWFVLITNTFLIPFILMGIGALTDLIWTSSYGIDFAFVKPMGDLGYRVYIVYFFALLSIFAQFFFGSVLFRRYHFLFTMLAQGAIGTLFIISMIWLDKIGVKFEFLNDFAKYLGDKLGMENFYDAEILIASVFFALITAVLWLISWKRFRKLQITK